MRRANEHTSSEAFAASRPVLINKIIVPRSSRCSFRASCPLPEKPYPPFLKAVTCRTRKQCMLHSLMSTTRVRASACTRRSSCSLNETFVYLARRRRRGKVAGACRARERRRGEIHQKREERYRTRPFIAGAMQSDWSMKGVRSKLLFLVT